MLTGCVSGWLPPRPEACSTLQPAPPGPAPRRRRAEGGSQHPRGPGRLSPAAAWPGGTQTPGQRLVACPRSCPPALRSWRSFPGAVIEWVSREQQREEKSLREQHVQQRSDVLGLEENAGLPPPDPGLSRAIPAGTPCSESWAQGPIHTEAHPEALPPGCRPLANASALGRAPGFGAPLSRSLEPSLSISESSGV